jgi:hypothetical protein
VGDSGSCCGYYDNSLARDFGICLKEGEYLLCLSPIVSCFSSPIRFLLYFHFVFQNQPIVEYVWGRFLKSTDTSVASAVGPSVTRSSTDFSFQNLVYLNFQWQKSLKNQDLPHSESKSYQINSIKSCSSRSFQQHQRHIPIPPKFSATI